MIDISHLSGTYSFPDGIVGFEDVKEYGISDFVSINGDVIGMVSKDLVFICIDPFIVKPDYKIDIDNDAKKFLNNVDEKDLAIICIVSLSDKSTINLSAPIVLDIKSRIGMQYIGKQNWDNIRYKFDVSKIKGLQELIDFKLKRRP